MKSKNESVYPVPCNKIKVSAESFEQVFTKGITKREYFAALAMQAMVSKDGNRGEEYIVSEAVKIADELIKQLKKP